MGVKVNEYGVKEITGGACPRCKEFMKHIAKVTSHPKCGYYDPEEYVVVNGALKNRKKMMKKLKLSQLLERKLA